MLWDECFFSFSSGSVVANPMSNTIPKEEWLQEIENKYAMQINGEIDTTRLRGQLYITIMCFLPWLLGLKGRYRHSRRGREYQLSLSLDSLNCNFLSLTISVCNAVA